MNLRSSIILSALQQYGSRVIMVGVSMVIARLLTPAQMGVYAVSAGVIALLQALRGMGVGSYFVTTPTLTTEDLRTQNGINWLLGVGFAALLLGISGPAAAFYGNPEVATCIRILAVSHLLNPIGSASQLILTREMRFDARLWIGLTSTSMLGVVATLLALLGAGPLSLAWGQVASNITSSLGSLIFVPSAAFLRPSLRDWRKPFQFGGWLTAAGMAGGFGMQASRLITGRTLGLASAALYGRALSTVDLVSSLFYGSVTAPALPAFAAAEREAVGGMARVYLRLVAVITGICWPAYVVLAIWAEPLVVLLYGGQWRASAALLPWVCVANILTFAAMPYHEVLIARQCVRLFFFCEFGLLLDWLGLLLVASSYGLQAVAWAQALSSVIALVVYIVALRKVIGLRLVNIIDIWSRSLIPTIAVGVVAALVRLSPLATHWPLIPVLALTGALGGLAWLATIWLVKHELRDHLAELLRWGWGKMQLARL